MLWDMRFEAHRLESRLHFSAAPVSVSINVGGPSYMDSTGHLWSADKNYIGGVPKTWEFPVANTADAPLFTARRGGTHFSYAIPIENGNYTLKLGFAESFFTQPGQ